MTGSAIWLGLAAALAAAAVSLTVTAAVNSDPLVWVMWSRQLTGHGAFDTWSGPAWHPLPVLVLMPFTLITRGRADIYYWLLIARFGAAALVVVGGFTARRFAGASGGLLAALLLVGSTWWLNYGLPAAAEPLMAALLGAALLADGHHRHRSAAALCVLAAMIRPEAWPFIGAYFLYLVYRRRVLSWGSALLAGVVVLVSWLVPNLLNSGQGAFTAAKSAPNASVAVHARVPFLDVLAMAREQLTTVVAVLAAIGVLTVLYAILRPRRRGSARAGSSPSWDGNWRLIPRDPREWALVGFGVGSVLIVALMAQLRIASGSPRYLLPGSAALTVEAAVVAIRLARLPSAPGRGRSPAAGIALAFAVLAVTALSLAQSRSWIASALTTARDRVTWTPQIKHELATLRCPGWYWTDLGHAAWLALASGQTLQQSQAHGDLQGLRRSGLLVCAPRHPPPIH